MSSPASPRAGWSSSRASWRSDAFILGHLQEPRDALANPHRHRDRLVGVMGHLGRGPPSRSPEGLACRRRSGSSRTRFDSSGVSLETRLSREEFAFGCGCSSPIWPCRSISSLTSSPSSATQTTPSSSAGSCARWFAAREPKPFVGSGRGQRMALRCFGEWPGYQARQARAKAGFPDTAGHPGDCRSPCPSRGSSPPRGWKVLLTNGVAFLGCARLRHADPGGPEDSREQRATIGQLP